MTETDAAIAADVGNFISRCIDTVPHLEGLLLLWKSAPQRWTESDIAARIYVTPDVARQVVRDLEQRQLLTHHLDPSSSYSFNPQSDAASLLPCLARVYCKNLVAVTQLIHSKR
jgi:hypothetical protein